MRAKRTNERRVAGFPSFLIAALLASLCHSATVAAQEEPQEPVVRARLDPADVVTVGQPVTVEVEVLVPSFFTGAPRFSDLDVPGALVIFNDRGRNLTERRGGRTWTGQSRSYTVYPQRPGSYAVSGIEVEVPYSVSGGAGTTARVSPDPMRFEATVPPGAEDSSYFIATAGLDMTQELTTGRGTSAPAGAAPRPGEPADADQAARPTADAVAPQTAPDTELRTLRVGDSLTRTITVTVRDALSMIVPPLDLGAPDGLAAYPRPPTVEDTSGERGERAVGTRRESTTFVAAREGSYELPAVELSWWDVPAQQLRRSAVPSIDVEVVANPDLAAEFVPTDDAAAAAREAGPPPRIDVAAWARRFGLPLLLLIVGSVGAAHLARRLGFAVPHPWRESPATRREARLFRDFRRAARSGQAPETARAFMRWLDTWYRRPATYAEFSARASDPEIDRQGRALADTLYGGPDKRPGAWTGRTLARHVRRARRAAGTTESAPGDSPLPPLNP